MPSSALQIAAKLASMSQLRSGKRVIAVQKTDPIEKQSKYQTDFSGASAGTEFAKYKTDIGGLHGPAGAGKRRRRSTCLRVKDCENLLLAAQQATAIGSPLNRFLTIHFGAAGIDDPVQAIGKLLKLMGDWLR